VTFCWSTAVHGIEAPRIHTSRGLVEAEAVVVCPGDDVLGLFADRIAAYGLTRCQLQMLRIAPERGTALGAAVMSDLGLARYSGYAALPEARALQARLDREQAAHRAHGVHLIVVQSADGSLVVGDSHAYDPAPAPFAQEAVDWLILDEMEAVLDLGSWRMVERWLGTYASAADRWRLTDAPDAATRIVIVTAGCGASTAFAIGEETIAGLFN
jgi:FAD dependent oxidoreductase TIGR03364